MTDEQIDMLRRLIQDEIEVAGVDLLFHDDGYRICEANSAPGFKGFEESLGINIPQKVFDYARLRTNS